MNGTRGAGSEEWRTIDLDRGDDGVRVDRVLLRHLRREKAVSRNRIQKWIEAGNVLVNGTAPPRPAWRIQAGDELRVRVSEIPKRARPQAQVLAIDILYEDDDLLAVNKPPGLVVHPSFGNVSGTLMNGLLALAHSWPAGSKPALVGRLDKHTSGIVLVTKRTEIYAAVQRAMDARRVDKDYLAIVRGKPSPRGTINLALDRDPWDRRRVTVTDRGGQPSVTRYERLSSVNGYSLVRCRLITGRTHQIRVHLAAKQWPIVGDATYGAPLIRLKPDTTHADTTHPGIDVAARFPRQALHSWRVALRQPRTGRELVIEAPMPADMAALADAIGLPAMAFAREGLPA